MLKSAIARTVLDTMHVTGMSPLLRRMLRGAGTIFCLHRVVSRLGPQSGFAPNDHLEITPELLDQLLSWLGERGYEFLSLSQVADKLSAGNMNGKPFACFTLDDGYLDNLIEAMPVFDRHNCPFTVYVCSNVIDGTCEMWWLLLEAVIAGSPTLDVSLGGEASHFKTRTSAEKFQAFRALAPRIQALPEYDQRAWIRELCTRAGVDVMATCKPLAMTWNQVRQMNANPLATIGAHTLNHYAISRLSEDDARRELVQSGQRLAAELGAPVEHFAYPYGNVAHAGPRDFRLAAEAGYKTAVTTRLGNVYPEHAAHLHALPRLIVSSRFQKLRQIEGLMSGLPGALLNRMRLMNVG